MSGTIQFDIGDVAVNAYSQEVEVMEVENDEIVFKWLHQDSIDVLSTDEFIRYFKKVK